MSQGQERGEYVDGGRERENHAAARLARPNGTVPVPQTYPLVVSRHPPTPRKRGDLRLKLTQA